MNDIVPAEVPPRQQALVDSVLLIDGDNDPHLPPEFPISERALVRVFLRTDAKMPRSLERRLSDLQFFVTVRSPKGGANAADFVMSLHCGMLHATLPMHVPFMMVTADKSLAVMVQELQRVGRQAELWTSHPERGGRAVAVPSTAVRRPSGGRGRGRGRGRSRSAAAPAVSIPAPAAEVAGGPAPEAAAAAPTAPAKGGKTLEQVAAAYAARLARIKDPPSRLKTLLNDIKNRTAGSVFPPEVVLEEIKRSHGVSVDAAGKVHRT